MFNEFNDQIKKNTQDLQEFLQNPQKFWTDLQEKNKSFTQDLQQFFSTIPNETSAYFKEQQEKAQELNTHITELLNKTPADVSSVTKAVLEHTQANVAAYVEKTKETTQKLQDIVKKHSK